jgi:hypothetical protein
MPSNQHLLGAKNIIPPNSCAAQYAMIPIAKTKAVIAKPFRAAT